MVSEENVHNCVYANFELLLVKQPIPRLKFQRNSLKSNFQIS